MHSQPLIHGDYTNFYNFAIDFYELYLYALKEIKMKHHKIEEIAIIFFYLFLNHTHDIQGCNNTNNPLGSCKEETMPQNISPRVTPTLTQYFSKHKYKNDQRPWLQ